MFNRNYVINKILLDDIKIKDREKNNTDKKLDGKYIEKVIDEKNINYSQMKHN